MSVKIDDFELIKKDAEESKGIIHEMRSVSRVSTGAPRSIVEHKIASTKGSVVKDTGRLALKVVLEGEIMGETAKQSLSTLWSKFEAGEPVPFTSDFTTLVQIQKVVIEQVRISQRVGEVDRYHYELLLREYVEPSQSESEAPEQKEEAEGEVAGDSEA